MDFALLERRLKRTLPDARIVETPLPGALHIRLGLINADYPEGPLDPAVMRAVLEQPAYWAFCWGSGLALASYLGAHPDMVAGRRVVDLGSGSGVVAIAASLAGAARVIACDTDPDALEATRINAAANGCRVETAGHADAVPRDNDLLLMADVLYDRTNLRLLDAARQLAATLLVADSRITEPPGAGFTRIGSIDAKTQPNLGEFDEFRTVRLFRAGPWPPPRR